MKKIVFLVSGNGGSLKAVFHAITYLKLEITIEAVIGDRECSALDFAKKNSIPTHQVTYNSKNRDELFKVLKTYHPDVIVTNIHKVLDQKVLDLHKEKYINLHYSLLPAFAGLIGMKTVEMAEIQNTGFIGGTCHEVNTDLDGGRIICQAMFTSQWDRDDNKIDTVFKLSSLCLINGIVERTETWTKTAYKKLNINDHEVLFSPPLRFEVSRLDNAYWNDVKKR